MRLARQFFGVLLLFPLIALSGCEGTDIEEVGMGGVWDATGDLRVDVARNLKLTIGDEVDGAFTGTWTEANEFNQQISGTLAGQRSGNSVDISLFGGIQGVRSFDGDLDDIWAMRGNFIYGQTTVSGSFRRSNF